MSQTVRARFHPRPNPSRSLFVDQTKLRMSRKRLGLRAAKQSEAAALPDGFHLPDE
jgi:hypothetical protein